MIMRQVFSSARLENVEAVAQLLRDAGIEVRISDGRSYKGTMRSRASYSDPEVAKPAVWVVQSNDQVRAREILRENGLIDSTRPSDSFIPLTFRSGQEQAGKTPAPKRAFKIKVFLLVAMAVIIVLSMLRGCYSPQQQAVPAMPPTPEATGPAGTPESLALVVFAHELGSEKMVLCLSIDDVDASGAVVAAMGDPGHEVMPASQCIREYDPDKGSLHAASGRPALLATVRSFKATAPDEGTVEFEAFHHGEFAHYKTLQVRREEGAWRVVKVLRHVASQGFSG